jgi:hypothetical protein
MTIALVQHASGQGSAATTNPAFSVASTVGNLVVLGFAADDYNGTPNAGWTQSTGMEQQTFHGGYIWWRISAGETSFAYTIGSATDSAWVLAEFSGVAASPYDASNGTLTQSSGNTQATPTITPTAGDRLLVAGGGISNNGGAFVPSSWTNSFTIIDSFAATTGTTKDGEGLAYRLLTADGVTGFTTTATFSGSGQSRTGLIIAFKAAAGAAAHSLVAPRQTNRHPRFRM